MKVKIDLSIIIVSYNTRQLLNDCLESIYKNLVKTKLVYEIIVIDNGSTDGSPELIRQSYREVKLITNKTNAGFAKANNQGIKAAAGNILLLLNSDTLVREQAVENLYEYFRQLPAKSIAGGKLYNLDNTPQSSCGPAYTLPMIFTALFLKGDYLSFTRYSPDTIKKVDWVMGACMMMRKQAFAEIGYFDEDIFMYMEEIDWQHRAKKLGYAVYFYPEAKFFHLGAGSSKGRTTPILNVFRGFIYFYKKHFPVWQNFFLRLILVGKSLLAIMLFSLLNNKTDRLIYVRALKISLTP